MHRTASVAVMAGAGLAGAALAGCSTTPSLDSASGAPPGQTSIVIADVVRRVKCEIADAFDDKLADRRYDWLWNWTAKVDLQLQVIESAGATPSVAYTHYYPNAYLYGAGSELTNANLIGYFQQTFTLAGGANYNTQAQRAETVSFTLPLQEVKAWRAGLDARADADCAATGRELRGNLGLKEWVDSALYPVSIAELQAGLHPQAPESSGPPSVQPRSAVAPAASDDQPTPVARAKADIAASHATANLAYRKTVEHQAAVATALSGAQAAMQTTIAPYLPVLTDRVRGVLSSNLAALSVLDQFARDDVEHARDGLREIEDIERRADEAAPGSGFSSRSVGRAAELAADERRFAEEAGAREQRAKRIAAGLVAFKPNPPIDGLLHSVEFVVAFGGSVSPTWTLLLWKGPGSLPGLSAQGVRTNSLNIALGPAAEQTRLITNQLISNVGAHP